MGVSDEQGGIVTLGDIKQFLQAIKAVWVNDHLDSTSSEMNVAVYPDALVLSNNSSYFIFFLSAAF